MSGQSPEERARSARDEIGAILEGDRRGRHTSIRRFLSLLLVGTVLTIYVYVRSQPAIGSSHTVTVETSVGVLVIEVYPEIAPQSVLNFERLVKAGFYDGLSWHRVDDWIVQTGDPSSAGRTAEPLIAVPFEASLKLTNKRGSIGMARSVDMDSASTQWYILKSDAPWLDSKYAVFGKVVSGMEVVDQIQAGDKVLRIKMDPSGR